MVCSSEDSMDDGMSDEQHSLSDPECGSEESSLDGEDLENVLPKLYDLLGKYISACGGESVNAYSFACGGEVLNHLLPRSIFITDLGDLPLPLSMNDANRLQQICEHAPYGKGKQTLVDTNVRKAWQLDAAKVRLENLPWKLAASDALTSLGLLEDHVEINLYKLLLYYKGGHFKSHRDTEKEPGMLATLIFQLPTECGHEGGTLVVQHGEEIKRFGFTRKSDSSFYHVAFYADCEHKLEEVIEGCRFCLVFNVVRKRNKKHIMVERFPENLSSLEAVLTSWLEQVKKHCAAPEKLVFLLSHKYTETNLCFAGLKRHDHSVAYVLGKCCDDLSLDLHLCLLKKQETYADGDRVDEVEFRPEKWISREDETVEFESLNLDLLTEIVKRKDDNPLEGLEPDSIVEEEYTGNAGPTEEYFYYLAALVIWPRFSSAEFVSMSSFLSHIKRVEDDEENARLNLRELLGICEQYPQKIWTCPNMGIHYWRRPKVEKDVKDVIANRLLQLCLNVGETEDVLRMIKIFAEAFRYVKSMSPSKIAFARLDPSRSTYEGIFTAEVAKTLAFVVKTKGWQPCGSSILENLLLEDRFTIEAEHYATLGLELTSLGCRDFAILVAQKIISLLNCKGKESFSLQGAALSAIGVLVFTLGEESMVSSFIKQSHYASTQSLCDVVFNLKNASATNSLNLKEVSIFAKLCQMLVDRDLLGSKEGESPPLAAPSRHVHRMMSIFLWLQNEEVLDLVVNKIVHEAQSNETPLRDLLRDATFWEEAKQTDMGKAATKKLAQECLRILKSKSKPVFSWCQPDATFPRSPQVEEFLRGPKETFIQTDFNNLPHARNYAAKYFGGRTATATAGGRGRNAFCTIRKTRAYFDGKVKNWEAAQEEAARLSSLLNEISGTVAKRAKTGGFIDLTSETVAGNGGLIDLTMSL